MLCADLKGEGVVAGWGPTPLDWDWPLKFHLKLAADKWQLLCPSLYTSIFFSRGLKLSKSESFRALQIQSSVYSNLKTIAVHNKLRHLNSPNGSFREIKLLSIHLIIWSFNHLIIC